MEGFFSKMTQGMLWTIVVPVSILIVMLSVLVGASVPLVWRANQISYKGNYGEITAKVTKLEGTVNSSIADVESLSKHTEKLNKSLDYFIIKNPPSSKNKSLHTTKERININSMLKTQSNLLSTQKEKLETINKDLEGLKLELKKIPSRN